MNASQMDIYHLNIQKVIDSLFYEYRGRGRFTRSTFIDWQGRHYQMELDGHQKLEPGEYIFCANRNASELRVLAYAQAPEFVVERVGKKWQILLCTVALVWLVGFSIRNVSTVEKATLTLQLLSMALVLTFAAVLFYGLYIAWRKYRAERMLENFIEMRANKGQQ